MKSAPWSKVQIRMARKAPLSPLLLRRGLQLQPLANGNLCVTAHDDLIVKDSFWRWPSKGIGGNAIDYFILVEGCSFHQAMHIVTQS